MERKPSGLINFSAARARQKTQIAAKAATSRGSELLGMIRLDIVTFDLLDMPPIRYEAFMKTFGKTNTLQASCQSGEDNLEVEVQTEEVTRATAWTQRPPTFGGEGDDLDPREVRSSLLGVGWEEKKALDEEVEYVQSSSSLRLATFIQGAGEAILTMLEEDQARHEGSHAESVPQRDIDFADSITVLRMEQTPCLAGLGVSLVEFSPDHPSSLLTVHSSSSSTSCLLCLWNVSQPSRPSHILSCSSLVSAVCLPTACMVVAGCAEGEMALWDLRETSAAHHQLREEEDEEGILRRAPTYVSQGSHASKVLHSFSFFISFSHLQGGVSASPSGWGRSTDTCLRQRRSDRLPSCINNFVLQGLAAFQLVSVENQGRAVVWTVLDTQRDFNTQLGLAHWGQVNHYECL